MLSNLFGSMVNVMKYSHLLEREIAYIWLTVLFTDDLMEWSICFLVRSYSAFFLLFIFCFVVVIFGLVCTAFL